MTKTLADTVSAELLRRREAKRVEEDRQLEILSMMPDTLPVTPLVVVQSACTTIQTKGAWLCFSDTFDKSVKGYEILQILEDAGFTLLPCSAAKYGQYATSGYVGAVQDLPTQYPPRKPTVSLTTAEEVAPLFLDVDTYNAQAISFYTGPDGGVYRVSVPIRNAMLTYRKNSYVGGWSYEAGSGRVIIPREEERGIVRSPRSIVTQPTGQSIRAKCFFEKSKSPDNPVDILKQIDGE